MGITTRTIKQRFNEHCKADSGIGRAIRKYGVENFNVSCIDRAVTKEQLYKKEIDYIAELDTYKNGYNQTLGGEGITTQIEIPIVLDERDEHALGKIQERISFIPRTSIATPTEILLTCLSLLFTCEYESERKHVAKFLKTLATHNKEELSKLISELCPFIDDEYINVWAK